MKVLIMEYCKNSDAIFALENHLKRVTPITGVDYLSDIKYSTVYHYGSFDLNSQEDYDKLSKSIKLLKIIYPMTFIEVNIINNIMIIKFMDNKKFKSMDANDITSINPIKGNGYKGGRKCQS